MSKLHDFKLGLQHNIYPVIPFIATIPWDKWAFLSSSYIKKKSSHITVISQNSQLFLFFEIFLVTTYLCCQRNAMVGCAILCYLHKSTLLGRTGGATLRVYNGRSRAPQHVAHSGVRNWNKLIQKTNRLSDSWMLSQKSPPSKWKPSL